MPPEFDEFDPGRHSQAYAGEGVEKVTCEKWATCTTHDGPVEHWRVTALLAKDAKRLWDALVALPKEEREQLPDEVNNAIRCLFPTLQRTDYFLSGLREGSKQSYHD